MITKTILRQRIGFVMPRQSMKMSIILTPMFIFLMTVTLFASDKGFENQKLELSGQILAKKQLPQQQLQPGQASDERTDVKVLAISTSQCYCLDHLNRVDAMLMSNIFVNVKNEGVCGGENSNQEYTGLLDITYYDLQKQRMMNAQKTFRIRPRQTSRIKMVDGYVLLKKSVGIQATVINRSRGLGECNTRNNKLKVKECNFLY